MAWVVNSGGRLYSRKIMCRIQWHFRRRSEPINFYNILVSDRPDLTLSIISYLLSDRRSDTNTILVK